MSATQQTRPADCSKQLWVCQLGRIPYAQASAMQARIRALRQIGQLPDSLLLLEHPPVYTRGRRSREQELPLGESFYRSHGIEVLDTNRGGRLTYHAPGQLVGYPIMRVADINRHLRTMEAAIVAALGEYGLGARSRCEEGPDYTGVWIEDRKIASIGVHVSGGVATHGFAVNIDNDLEPFSWVIACGLDGVKMTSLEHELGEARGDLMGAFRQAMARRFCEAHARSERVASPTRLRIADLLVEAQRHRQAAGV